MSVDVVIGIGNGFRRDDGVGLAVADEIAKRGLSGVRVVTAIGEPAAILEAWSRRAARGRGRCGDGRRLRSGRIRRWTPGDEADPGVVSSHAIGLPQAYALGQALGQIPGPVGGSQRRRREHRLRCRRSHRRSPQLCLQRSKP